MKQHREPWHRANISQRSENLFNTAAPVTGTLDTSTQVTSSVKVTVNPTLASIAFRSNYSADGNYILQAGKDRLLVFQANSLAVYDEYV